MFRAKKSEKAQKALKKLDKQIAGMMIAWIEKNLEGTNNPRKTGKGLSHDKKGIWRYRVGNYRILANIIDDKCITLMIEFGYRKDISK